MRHRIIATTARVHARVKLFVQVAVIVGLCVDLVYVIWKAGHLVDLLLFAVLLALHHLERNPRSSSQ